ncbi:uncharacterized protein LOC133464916 [Cololabis saira]|uniref:uncharacterized protein LOC133464916 n=1 Tax=Cololabis saira TaxID=129043 RepID=UPI002AD1E904|nr:uncharacterized protein LOC133464916 [Cololabis saira]
MNGAMFKRKQPLFDGYGDQSLHLRKRRLRDRSHRGIQHERLTENCGDQRACEGQAKRRTHDLTDTTGMSSWADTQNSVKTVLEHLNSKQAISDLFIDDSVNRKFLSFRRDITGECGIEDKQHSWAVIEKQDELIMYGPYYPNYDNGEHSEDAVVKQTQELLDTGGACEDWEVYVFSMNSPCLARNTKPCMLNLVHKAQEWWSVYGVKTHIGYMRCWGFKGIKENLFKDISYGQVECINQSVDYESYIKAAERSPDLNPLCEAVFSVAQHLLRSGRESVILATAMEKQEMKSYFKSMSTHFECKGENERKLLTEEVGTLVEAAGVLLSGKSESYEEYLERERAFTRGYTFSSQVCDAAKDEMRLIFQKRWRELVQDKYAEVVRERLTDDFNQCTVQLFIKDILKFIGVYLKIGKLQFEDAEAV